VLRAELVQSAVGGLAVRVTTEAGGAGLSSALRALVEMDATILACDTESASLDDLFRTVIRHGAASPHANGSMH
jgi:hypothetical protein